MRIYFGLALDDVACPLPQQTVGGVQYLGPLGLLQMLESHLGLFGHPPENEYLRIEQYRQALRTYLREQPASFFRASFEADQFATAADLLARRDELLLAGWDFQEWTTADCPARLQCLGAIEAMFDGDQRKLAAGYADRFTLVSNMLEQRRQPVTHLYITEPFELLPTHFQRLLQKLIALGATLQPLEPSSPQGESDLAVFQRTLINGEKTDAKIPLQGDGSLLILSAHRETDLAAFTAKLLQKNPDFQPVCLIPDKNRALDYALPPEGLPGMGIPSASLARPTLQVLKLVTAFLWNPVDPFKIMEFVSLAIKPLEADLANRIAAQMAQTPGLNSDSWYAMMARYFEETEARAQRDPTLDLNEIRFQYRFWFERRRYDSASTVPKEEVIQIFNYLHRWARARFDEHNNSGNSLLVLSEQARRIGDLLEALPETQLGKLELERIVRTIYEPAPVNLQPEEAGRLPYLHQPNAFIGDVDTLLWVHFCQSEPVHFFSRWYRSERTWLQARHICLRTPEDENQLLIWQRRQPILRTRQRLVLAIPAVKDGTETLPHPLLGNLEATFSNLSDITLDLNQRDYPDTFAYWTALPQQQPLPFRRLGQPRPFLHIRSASKLEQRPEETLSSLETLFYYPYQWVFKHKIKLHKSSLLSIVKDPALMGNLAHRFFEQLLREDLEKLDKAAIEQWIDERAEALLRKEGAVLLMYGREPERIAFIKKIKFAAWSLVQLIRQNGWRVLDTEKTLVGEFMNISVNGRADVVLEKEGELAVLDLKWRGARRREEIIRNEEDLQLVIYSKLLTEEQAWAHSAYFIIENGKLIARNNAAFREARAIAPDSQHTEVHPRILARMEQTYQWRVRQIQAGQVEIRCQQTLPQLEEAYAQDAMLELLEMRTEDAWFDDYRTLINLIA